MELDCPICLDMYDEGRHAPVKTFCCAKTLCLSCLENIASNTSSCPWDKKRWVQRSVIKKCLSNTPDNYLQQIKAAYNKQDKSQSSHPPMACPLLGDGCLKEDYDYLVRARRAEDKAQIEKDDEVASELLHEEEAQRLRYEESREAMLLEDRRIAAELSQQLLSEATATNSSTRNSGERLTEKSRKSLVAPNGVVQGRHSIKQYFTSTGSGTCDQVSVGMKPTSTSTLARSSCRSSSSGGVGGGSKRKIISSSYVGTKKKISSDASLSTSVPFQQQAGTIEDVFSPDFIDITSPARVALSRSLTATQPVPPPPSPAPLSPTATVSWNCMACTFSNNDLLHVCEMCGKNRVVEGN